MCVTVKRMPLGPVHQSVYPYMASCKSCLFRVYFCNQKSPRHVMKYEAMVLEQGDEEITSLTTKRAFKKGYTILSFVPFEVEKAFDTASYGL